MTAEEATVFAVALATEAPADNLPALTPAASAAAATEAIRAEVRTLTVTGPDIQGLLSAVAVDVAVVPTMDVDSDEMAQEMLSSLGRLSTVSGAIEAERLERGGPLRKTLQWLQDGYSPAKASVDEIIIAGKEKLVGWNKLKQERARKAAEAEAEARRLAAAAAAKAEAEALAAAQAAAVAAQAARAEGSEQVADAMETQAMVQVDTARQNAAVAAQALYVAPVRMGGGYGGSVKGSSETWKARCTDKAALIKHIGAQIEAGDLSLLDVLDVSDKNLNALAKLQKKNLKLPGVAPYTEDRVAIRKQAVSA